MVVFTICIDVYGLGLVRRELQKKAVFREENEDPLELVSRCDRDLFGRVLCEQRIVVLFAVVLEDGRRRVHERVDRRGRRLPQKALDHLRLSALVVFVTGELGLRTAHRLTQLLAVEEGTHSLHCLLQPAEDAIQLAVQTAILLHRLLHRRRRDREVLHEGVDEVGHSEQRLFEWLRYRSHSCLHREEHLLHSSCEGGEGLHSLCYRREAADNP